MLISSGIDFMNFLRGKPLATAIYTNIFNNKQIMLHIHCKLNNQDRRISLHGNGGGLLLQMPAKHASGLLFIFGGTLELRWERGSKVPSQCLKWGFFGMVNFFKINRKNLGYCYFQRLLPWRAFRKSFFP